MRLMIAALLLLPVGAASGRAQDAAPAGMILQASGAAEVERAGSRNPARLADLLYPGDRIVTGAGEVRFVYCPDPSMVHVAGDSTIAIGPTAIAVVSGQPPSSVGSQCAIPQVALGDESMERVGGLRGRGYPPIALFLGGKISQAHPLFAWDAVDGAGSYHLSLTTVSGAFVWETDTSEPAARYPESMPALTDGATYRWEVTATSRDEVVAQQSANIVVVPGDRAGASDPAGSAANDLIRAVALENEGYYAETTQIYRRLRDGASDRIGRRLAWLYWTAGLVAAANAELDRLP